jgi:polyhydroxyalkanoate synthesis regulator phasin
MMLQSQRELDHAREKLRLLERVLADASAETQGDAEVRYAELESLQRRINHFQEEIARYQAHQPRPSEAAQP